MQMHESIYKYMHIVHSITCIKAISMRLHVSMQISAWMCISSLAYGGKRVPPILHQSETCYVHHSLADIDTKKLLTGEINQAVWWPNRPFFKIGQSCCLRLFCRSLTAELSWSGLVKDPIGNWHNARIYAFWVALINNWWLHGRWEIQFLAERLRTKLCHQRWVAFLHCTQVVKLGSRSSMSGDSESIWCRASKLLSFLLAFLSTFFCYQSVLTFGERVKSEAACDTCAKFGDTFSIQTLASQPELIQNSTL